MKKYITLFFVILFSTNILADTAKENKITKDTLINDLKEMEEKLHKNPNDAFLHNQIGISYEYFKEFIKAEYHLKKATELDVKNYYYWFSLGSFYVLHKRYKDAIVASNSCIDSFESYVPCYLLLGASYRQMKNYENAILFLKKGIDKLHDYERSIDLKEPKIKYSVEKLKKDIEKEIERVKKDKEQQK